MLDALERPFDPAVEARRRDLARGRQPLRLPPRPLDVLLATNMLSVGADVQQLGLMVVAAQPRTAANSGARR